MINPQLLKLPMSGANISMVPKTFKILKFDHILLHANMFHNKLDINRSHTEMLQQLPETSYHAGPSLFSMPERYIFTWHDSYSFLAPGPAGPEYAIHLQCSSRSQLN